MAARLWTKQWSLADLGTYLGHAVDSVSTQTANQRLRNGRTTFGRRSIRCCLLASITLRRYSQQYATLQW